MGGNAVPKQMHEKKEGHGLPHSSPNSRTPITVQTRIERDPQLGLGMALEQRQAIQPPHELVHFIEAVRDDGPAAHASVRILPGDELVAVNGVRVAEAAWDSVVEQLQLPVVQLTLLRYPVLSGDADADTSSAFDAEGNAPVPGHDNKHNFVTAPRAVDQMAFDAALVTKAAEQVESLLREVEQQRDDAIQRTAAAEAQVQAEKAAAMEVSARAEAASEVADAAARAAEEATRAAERRAEAAEARMRQAQARLAEAQEAHEKREREHQQQMQRQRHELECRAEDALSETTEALEAEQASHAQSAAQLAVFEAAAADAGFGFKISNAEAADSSSVGEQHDAEGTNDTALLPRRTFQGQGRWQACGLRAALAAAAQEARAYVAGGLENEQDVDESDDELPSAVEATIRGLLKALRDQAAAAGVAAAERELSEGLRLDNDALRQLVNERSLELRCAHAGMGTNADAAIDASLISSQEQQPDKQNQSNGDTNPAASLDSLAQSQMRVMLDGRENRELRQRVRLLQAKVEMAEDVTQQADAAFRKRVAELRHLSTISQGSNAALQQQLAAENAQLTEDLDTVRAKLQSARRKLLVGDAEGTNANDEEMNIEMARTTADENQGSDSTQLELFSPAPGLRTPAATPVRAMAINSNRNGAGAGRHS
eukprot:g2624.t1